MLDKSYKPHLKTGITISYRDYALREQIRSEVIEEIRLAFANHRMQYDAFNDDAPCLTCGLPHWHQIHLSVGQTAVNIIKETLGNNFPILVKSGRAPGERDVLIIDMADMAKIVAGPIMPKICEGM